jgi:hypothetical protein
MTTRRGSLSQYPPGAGGVLFIATIQALTMPMTHEQRKIMYRGMYSVYMGKLQSDTAIKNTDELSTLIAGVKLLLDQQGDDYKSQFEDHSSYSKLENDYAELQAQIFDVHQLIIQKAKLMDTVVVTQEMVG